MGKELVMVILGIWVGLVPFLGFPSSWDTVLFAVSGALIALLALFTHRDRIAHQQWQRRQTDTFVQNTPDRTDYERGVGAHGEAN